jgi:hypothetical protein
MLAPAGSGGVDKVSSGSRTSWLVEDMGVRARVCDAVACTGCRSKLRQPVAPGRVRYGSKRHAARQRGQMRQPSASGGRLWRSVAQEGQSCSDFMQRTMVAAR